MLDILNLLAKEIASLHSLFFQRVDVDKQAYYFDNCHFKLLCWHVCLTLEVLKYFDYHLNLLFATPSRLNLKPWDKV
ncbi:MAG: hypothetical protein ACKO96_23980, partial [Flammeovirgaceae bacterium]